jgi:catechol 2,3-dioxygenase-like lactoylglutathione lyase family enzyme
VTDLDGLKVAFVAGFGPVVRDAQASQALYVQSLRLPLQAGPEDPGYFHGETLGGVRHFALWPLESAARSCFGTGAWPQDVPIPQAWIEFDVEDVRAASAALKQRGYTLLVDTRKEPWGQTVTRLLSPEGLLVGLTYTPWLREHASGRPPIAEDC